MKKKTHAQIEIYIEKSRQRNKWAAQVQKSAQRQNREHNRVYFKSLIAKHFGVNALFRIPNKFNCQKNVFKTHNSRNKTNTVTVVVRGKCTNFFSPFLTLALALNFPFTIKTDYFLSKRFSSFPFRFVSFLFFQIFFFSSVLFQIFNFLFGLFPSIA